MALGEETDLLVGEDAAAERTEQPRSRGDALLDVGVVREGEMDGGAQVLEGLDEGDVTVASDGDRGGIAVVVASAVARTEEGDRLRILVASADLHLEAPAREVGVYSGDADFEVVAAHEEEGAVVGVERAWELEPSGLLN